MFLYWALVWRFTQFFRVYVREHGVDKVQRVNQWFKQVAARAVSTGVSIACTTKSHLSLKGIFGLMYGWKYLRGNLPSILTVLAVYVLF